MQILTDIEIPRFQSPINPDSLREDALPKNTLIENLSE